MARDIFAGPHNARRVLNTQRSAKTGVRVCIDRQDRPFLRGYQMRDKKSGERRLPGTPLTINRYNRTDGNLRRSVWGKKSDAIYSSI